MEEAKLETFIEICQRFNQKGVKYVVCGAFASILHGIEKISRQHRPTKDYNFIIEENEENVRKIKEALRNLFDKIDELGDDEFKNYQTIQIVEEESGLVLDLIAEMWGIDYEIAIKDAVMIKIGGVNIPVLNIDHLINMKKDSPRPQDKFDIYWLTKIKDSLISNLL